MLWCFRFNAGFYKKLEIKSDKKIYCYAVVTCGGKVGNTFITMQDLLKAKNIDLSYRNEVYLPDNILSFWGKNTIITHWIRIKIKYCKLQKN